MGRFIIMGVNDGSDKGVEYFKKRDVLKDTFGFEITG